LPRSRSEGRQGWAQRSPNSKNSLELVRVDTTASPWESHVAIAVRGGPDRPSLGDGQGKRPARLDVPRFATRSREEALHPSRVRLCALEDALTE
jgi:hypothetical protein